MSDPDCIFCKIVSGEIPSHKIEEDDKTLAFMDINPWTRGHTGVYPQEDSRHPYHIDQCGPAPVTPKEHSRNLYDIDQGDLAAAHATAQRVAQRMRDRLNCEGINIVQSSEPAAMQTVFHTHVHVIPRYSDDGLKLPAHPKAAEHDELAAIAGELNA